MLQIANNSQFGLIFAAKDSDKDEQAVEGSRILPNNAKTRLRQNTQKIENAFVYYPIRGLKGDVNSNFYEFLTMGIVPYLAGSAMFMLVFNAANKHLNLFEKEKASVYGKKMALGVVLYGILKNLSKNLVTKPVKYATGVDTELPYQNIVYALPTEAGAKANIDIQYQQRKVYDSKEFFRKDLLSKEYFDTIASRLGMGKNLNDSESEVTPIIQNIVATTATAKSLSSYGWAAVGVGLAMQDCWIDFFNSISGRQKYVFNKNIGFLKNALGKINNIVKNTLKISDSFIKSFFKSISQMWKGKDSYSGFMKHSGKLLISAVALSTGVLTLNTIIRAKKMASNNNKETIDRSKQTTVI